MCHDKRNYIYRQDGILFSQNIYILPEFKCSNKPLITIVQNILYKLKVTQFCVELNSPKQENDLQQRWKNEYLRDGRTMIGELLPFEHLANFLTRTVNPKLFPNLFNHFLFDHSIKDLANFALFVICVSRFYPVDTSTLSRREHKLLSFTRVHTK